MSKSDEKNIDMKEISLYGIENDKLWQKPIKKILNLEDSTDLDDIIKNLNFQKYTSAFELYKKTHKKATEEQFNKLNDNIKSRYINEEKNIKLNNIFVLHCVRKYMFLYISDDTRYFLSPKEIFIIDKKIDDYKKNKKIYDDEIYIDLWNHLSKQDKKNYEDIYNKLNNIELKDLKLLTGLKYYIHKNSNKGNMKTLTNNWNNLDLNEQIEWRKKTYNYNLKKERYYDINLLKEYKNTVNSYSSINDFYKADIIKLTGLEDKIKINEIKNQLTKKYENKYKLKIHRILLSRIFKAEIIKRKEIQLQKLLNNNKDKIDDNIISSKKELKKIKISNENLIFKEPKKPYYNFAIMVENKRKQLDNSIPPTEVMKMCSSEYKHLPPNEVKKLDDKKEEIQELYEYRYKDYKKTGCYDKKLNIREYRKKIKVIEDSEKYLNGYETPKKEKIRHSSHSSKKKPNINKIKKFSVLNNIKRINKKECGENDNIMNNDINLNNNNRNKREEGMDLDENPNSNNNIKKDEDMDLDEYPNNNNSIMDEVMDLDENANNNKCNNDEQIDLNENPNNNNSKNDEQIDLDENQYNNIIRKKDECMELDDNHNNNLNIKNIRKNDEQIDLDNNHNINLNIDNIINNNNDRMDLDKYPNINNANSNFEINKDYNNLIENNMPQEYIPGKYNENNDLENENNIYNENNNTYYINNKSQHNNILNTENSIKSINPFRNLSNSKGNKIFNNNDKINNPFRNINTDIKNKKDNLNFNSIPLLSIPYKKKKISIIPAINYNELTEKYPDINNKYNNTLNNDIINDALNYTQDMDNENYLDQLQKNLINQILPIENITLNNIKNESEIQEFINNDLYNTDNSVFYNLNNVTNNYFKNKHSIRSNYEPKISILKDDEEFKPDKIIRISNVQSLLNNQEYTYENIYDYYYPRLNKY